MTGVSSLIVLFFLLHGCLADLFVAWIPCEVHLDLRARVLLRKTMLGLDRLISGVTYLSQKHLMLATMLRWYRAQYGFLLSISRRSGEVAIVFRPLNDCLLVN